MGLQISRKNATIFTGLTLNHTHATAAAAAAAAGQAASILVTVMPHLPIKMLERSESLLGRLTALCGTQQSQTLPPGCSTCCNARSIFILSHQTIHFKFL